VPVIPGAEPYRHEGGDIGVLLCHGFTGTPQSMRPWAEYLADRGHTVSVPLLPGHGTRWQDLRATGWQDWYAEADRALGELTARGGPGAPVFVFGLSMGGALTLRLAAKHGDAISGIALVNPVNRLHGASARLLPVLRHAVPSVPGLAGDIAKEGAVELGYDRVPLHAANSLRHFLRLLDRELPQVTQPVVLFTSPRDRVVNPADSERIAGRVSSTDVTRVVLEQSRHVATLDHDAERIFEESLALIGRLAPGAEQKGSRTGG
jgi:carboxylesterase